MALAVGLFGYDAAYAQETGDPAADEEIVVTGSRAARSGYQAPTPTSVIRAEAIDRQAATGIGELLVQNPAFKGTRNPGANATNTSSPGQWTADLRGLGGQRSLVLVDGARIVPFAPASNLSVPTTTDLNLIPTLMIDRVEVVTGGASAQYGSDAVAGVVNLIMKREYDGLQVRGQYGISQESDSEEQRLGILGGWNSEDDRLHVVLSADYVNNEGVGDIYTRDWGRKERMIVSNPGWQTNGLPAFIVADNVVNALGAGGIIAGPANFTLRGQTFNPDGTLRPFQFGRVGGSVMIGGEGQATITGTDLVPGVERLATYARVGYDFSNSLHGYVSLAYSESTGELDGVPPRLTGSQVTIRNDNAFLPQQVVDAMAAQSLTSFTMSRIGYDIGNNLYVINNKSPRFSAGLEGSFGDGWDWDAHVSYGRNDYSSRTYNNPITANLGFAIDAVEDGNGNIVCRATLPGPAFNAAAAGCQPLNLFGEGSPSAQAIAYIAGQGLSEVEYDQSAAAANLRGEPFSTWAGPVSASVGIEYRKETSALTADPIASANGFLTAGNAVPWSGEYDVTEGYIEAIVPLARDVAFADLIDFNAAIRYAEYSTAGGQTAWKVGAVWEPTEWLRFRATQSRDIRAPALNELYSPGSNVRNAVTIRNRLNPAVTNNPVIPQNTSLGNPNLAPEIGDTTTFGFVLRPASGPLDGLSLSVDYYSIELSDAITNLSTANIAGLCNSGNDTFCDLFTYDANGVATSLTAPALNIGGFVSSGYDISLDYTRELGPGSIEFNFGGTYVTESLVDTGIGPVVDRAGENGAANFGAVPTFRANSTIGYRTDDWSASLQAVYTSEGKLDNLYNTAPNLTVNDNSVPDYVLFNLYGSYNVTDNVRLFGAVENLLDRDPVATPYAILNAPVYGAYYDKVGRFFTVGIDFRF